MKRNKKILVAGCLVLTCTLATGAVLFPKPSNVTAKDEEPVVITKKENPVKKDIPKTSIKNEVTKQKGSAKEETVTKDKTSSDKPSKEPEIAPSSNAVAVNSPQVSQPANSGHYEDKWIEDSPAYDEVDYQTVGYFVCNGCGADLGTSEATLDAHGREAMLSGNYACGSWKTLYRSVPCGTIHHDAVGHYEKVWVAD